eukprot:COSAG02_NODE_67440_length_253_cov_0.642857_1_plen_20_part_10
MPSRIVPLSVPEIQASLARE